MKLSFDAFLKDARKPDEEVGFEPPLRIPCPRCDGELVHTGFNLDKTDAFIECNGRCKHAYVVAAGHVDHRGAHRIVKTMLDVPTVVKRLTDPRWFSPAATREQRISFAYGNLKIDRPNLTREEVERALDEMEKSK